MYWTVTYMPILVAVIYGRIWKVLDDEVKRIDKYARLSSQDGCTGRSSLCLDYHSFWIPLSILQAIRYRHWTVALSSTGSVLASIVIPVIQNYVFIWELYSGGSLAWPDTYSWQVTIADPFWSKVLASLLSVTLLCSFGLFILIPGQKTGLTEDPRGTASTHELILTKNHLSLQFNENADRQTFSDLCSELGPSRFHLLRRTNVDHMTLEKVNPSNSMSQPLTCRNCLPFNGTIQRQWSKLKPVLKVLKSFVNLITHFSINCPHFFLFQRVVFIPWLLFLSALLAFGIYIVTTMSRIAQAEQKNYSIPLTPDVYLIVGVFVQVCHLPVSATDV